MKKFRYIVLFLLCMIFLVGCAEQSEEREKPIIEESTETESSMIIEEEIEENDVQTEPVAPTKEEVLAMREVVLDGMTDDEKERLTQNIKVTNLQMERAYLNDGIANFVELIQDMQKSVYNEHLHADLQQLIDLTNLATETHEMEYANDI